MLQRMFGLSVCFGEFYSKNKTQQKVKQNKKVISEKLENVNYSKSQSGMNECMNF